jgi:hypothetical protein
MVAVVVVVVATKELLVLMMMVCDESTVYVSLMSCSLLFFSFFFPDDDTDDNDSLFYKNNKTKPKPKPAAAKSKSTSTTVKKPNAHTGKCIISPKETLFFATEIGNSSNKHEERFWTSHLSTKFLEAFGKQRYDAICTEDRVKGLKRKYEGGKAKTGGGNSSRAAKVQKVRSSNSVHEAAKAGNVN